MTANRASRRGYFSTGNRPPPPLETRRNGLYMKRLRSYSHSHFPHPANEGSHAQAPQLRHLSRRHFAALALGALAMPLRSPAQARAAGGEVNIYSARHYPADETLYGLFTKETGIKINVIQGTAEELMERVKLEGESSPADVFVTVDAGNLWRAQEAGVFRPTKSALLDEKIPKHYHEPDGHWFGFSTRARVVVYDTRKVKPADLSTYEELADPKWKSRLLVRSSNNIYNQSLLASIIEHDGDEKAEAWAKGLVANFRAQARGRRHRPDQGAGRRRRRYRHQQHLLLRAHAVGEG